MMSKAPSSFTFLLLFFIECPRHLCLPYAGFNQSQLPLRVSNPMKMEYYLSQRLQTIPELSDPWNDDIPHPHPPKKGAVTEQQHVAPHTGSWNAALIPHRPALVQVIVIACIAMTIALICGIIFSYIIYQLVQYEEKQQLLELSKNVKLAPLGEDEESGDESQEEFTYLLPENEKEMEKFIYSVIRSKRRKYLEKKRLEKEKMKDVKISAGKSKARTRDL